MIVCDEDAVGRGDCDLDFLDRKKYLDLESISVADL